VISISRKFEITLVGRLILVLAVLGGIIGMNFGLPSLWIPSFALIFYFLPFLQNYLTNLNISAERELSTSTVTLGGYLHCRLHIKNPNNSPLKISFENRFEDSIILIKGWNYQRVTLNPQELRVFSFIFTFRKRGIHKFFPILIYRSDPLGLLRDSIEIDDNMEIKVIPARPYIRLTKKQKRNVRDTLAGYYAYRRRGQGDEFFSLREYKRGDEPRKIYWKGSAKRRELISKEFTDELVFRSLIAVDIGWTMRSKKLEYALTSLLEYAEMNAQNNDAFGFILFDETPRKFLMPLKSSKLYEETAKLIYDQEAYNKQTRFESILPFIFSLKGTRGILIIISDTEGILDEKIKAINQIAKFGHQIVFCDIRGDKFGIYHSDISPYNLNTLEKIKLFEIMKNRTETKYLTRTDKIIEALDNINGYYIQIDSIQQNLLLELKKMLKKEERFIEQWMLNI
jgi:uncharacterized protein (DUF58 family)